MANDLAAIPVDIYTQHFHYHGLLATRGFRLADVLTEPTSAVVEIQNATVRPWRSSGTGVRCREVLLQKNKILLALPQATHEAPLKRLNYRKEKLHYGAVVVLPGCQLMGIIQLPERASAMTVISDRANLPSFLALTDVVITLSGPGTLPEQAPVALFRRQDVEAIHLSAEPVREPSREPEEPVSDDQDELAAIFGQDDLVVRPFSPVDPTFQTPAD
jgi:hypothetical protein